MDDFTLDEPFCTFEERGKLYLLVTRVRDEAHYLPELLESVAGQSLTPSLWVIVDHCSTDDSASIIARASEEKSWIKLVQVEATEGHGIFCHVAPLRAGFEAAVDYAARYHIPYEYLGILDADIVPEATFFEKLINYSKSSPELGIVGGLLFVVKGGSRKPEGSGRNPGVSGRPPRGGARLYRKDCFQDIGGIPRSALWDTETSLRAQLKGWQVSTLSSAQAIHRRPTYSRNGLWHGYWRGGKCYHYVNYHPVAAFLAGLLSMRQPPFYQGFAFLLGYSRSFLLRSEQSSDPVIRDYYWRSPDRLRSRVRDRAVSILKRVALKADDAPQ